MPPSRCNTVEYIKSNREFSIMREKAEHVISPGRRNEIEKSIDQIAVRVNDTDAVTRFDVLQNHIPQQHAFANARLPDNVHVRAPITRSNTKGSVSAPLLPHAN